MASFILLLVMFMHYYSSLNFLGALEFFVCFVLQNSRRFLLFLYLSFVS